MPRKNQRAKYQKVTYTVQRSTGKTKFGTKAAAEQAAELRMLENPGLTLHVYKERDGWYLTRQQRDN